MGGVLELVWIIKGVGGMLFTNNSGGGCWPCTIAQNKYGKGWKTTSYIMHKDLASEQDNHWIKELHTLESLLNPVQVSVADDSKLSCKSN